MGRGSGDRPEQEAAKAKERGEAGAGSRARKEAAEGRWAEKALGAGSGSGGGVRGGVRGASRGRVGLGGG